MRVIKPTYQDSLLQVANSVRKHLGLTTYHTTSKDIDAWIKEQDIKQVILFLVDGMGTYQIDSFLEKEDFFRTYHYHPIQSVFPPTTVAATTTIRTGFTPAQSKYLGWHQYQKDLQDSVTMFQSSSYYGEQKYPGYIEQTYAYKTTVEEAIEKGKQAVELFPFWKGNENHTIDDLCKSTIDAIAQGNTFVYSYWDEYDAFMHEHGVDSAGSIAILKKIEQAIQTMAMKLPPYVGLVVVADHGHVNVRNHSLLEHPELVECLRTSPTMEMRCVNFYIKDDYHDVFQQRFEAIFQDEFTLYSRQQIIEEAFFGNDLSLHDWEDEIGDFIAIAHGSTILSYGEPYAHLFRGHHAGMSEEEMMVPLIIYPK